MAETSSTVTTVVNKALSILHGHVEVVDMTDIDTATSVRIDTDESITVEMTFQDDSVVTQSTSQRIELSGVQVTAISITAGAIDATVYVSLRKAV